MNSIWIYLIVINLITFMTFGIDKFKAKHRLWRVPVAVLLMLSLIGGSLGGLLGMVLFQHKTKKMLFRIGLPVMLIVQVAVIVFLMCSGVLN